MSVHLYSEKKKNWVSGNLNLITGGIGIQIDSGLLALLAFSLRSPNLEIWGKWSEDLDFRVNGRVRVVPSTKIFQLNTSVKHLSILVLIPCLPFGDCLCALLVFSSSSDSKWTSTCKGPALSHPFCIRIQPLLAWRWSNSTRERLLRFWMPLMFLGASLVAQCRRPGSVPGSGRSPGEGNGHPLQYSHLEYPMDRGARGICLISSSADSQLHRLLVAGCGH